MKRFVQIGGVLVAVDAIVAIYPPSGGHDGAVRLGDNKNSVIAISAEEWSKLWDLLANDTIVVSEEQKPRS